MGRDFLQRAAKAAGGRRQAGGASPSVNLRRFLCAVIYLFAPAAASFTQKINVTGEAFLWGSREGLMCDASSPRRFHQHDTHTHAHAGTHTRRHCALNWAVHTGGQIGLLVGQQFYFLLSSQTHVALKSASPRTGRPHPVATLTFAVYNEALVSLQ